MPHDYQPWYAVDLDGTLAEYDHWRGVSHIGKPIAPMADRVKRWIAEGRNVRIFTARVSLGKRPTVQRKDEVAMAHRLIHIWCRKHLGFVLEVTCEKDFAMIELWDDRAVRVKINKGLIDNECTDH